MSVQPDPNSLHTTPVALRTAVLARDRGRHRPSSRPPIDAPFTAAALAAAATRWEQSTARYAADSASLWADATRFLRAVTAADAELSGRLSGRGGHG